VETVYNQIVTDLVEAESIIASGYVRAGVDDPAAAVTKPAIQALLSRVYLYMGNWQKAADYATLLINNPKYHLFTAASYVSQWGRNTADPSGEVIFEVYGSRKNEYWGNWDVIPWLVNPNGYADVASSADLRNLYEDDDIRGEATMFQSHPDAPDHFWTSKYPGKENTNRQENNTIVLRLSEMYLNRAEAIIRGNLTISGVSAINDLQAIAANRGATAQAATPAGVMTERRKELAFEGHIVFDLARTGTSLTRVDYQGAAQNQNIAFPDNRWALPIPKSEIDANKNCDQNP
ncbi:MAG: RagB/SusD family nutrient uptake outer membrane protein, partial [Bacteroidales bacterium]|nr:RagB/SusD family nutrient uptake outer membrane protein [Bacteroidales bacterium]